MLIRALADKEGSAYGVAPYGVARLAILERPEIDDIFFYQPIKCRMSYHAKREPW